VSHYLKKKIQSYTLLKYNDVYVVILCYKKSNIIKINVFIYLKKLIIKNIFIYYKSSN